MENTKQSGKQIALRVTDEMHARLKDIAEKERRSLHAQVVQFLGSWALLMMPTSCRCTAAKTRSHGVGRWLTSY